MIVGLELSAPTKADLDIAQSKVDKVEIRLRIRDTSILEAFKQVAKTCDYQIEFHDHGAVGILGLTGVPRAPKPSNIIVHHCDVSKYPSKYFASLPPEIVEEGPLTQMAYDPESKEVLYQDGVLEIMHTEVVLKLLGLYPKN